MSLVILHSNDLHGKLTPPKLNFLLGLRDQADLYFDSGDCIQAGNLSTPLFPDPVWPRLAQARCTASVIGNREGHVLTSALLSKLRGASHPVLCENLIEKSGQRPLPGWCLAGETGVIGVSVPMVTRRMASAAVSQLLWEPPVQAVQRVVDEIKGRCSAIFVLSHLGLAEDRKLARAVGGLDAIFGGHSHSVLREPEVVNGVFIVQGGSHARFLGRYEWDGSRLSGGLIDWQEG